MRRAKRQQVRRTRPTRGKRDARSYVFRLRLQTPDLRSLWYSDAVSEYENVKRADMEVFNRPDYRSMKTPRSLLIPPTLSADMEALVNDAEELDDGPNGSFVTGTLK